MATSWESGFTELKLDFDGTKNLAIGKVVHSDDFSAGGHLWRVKCYPHGDKADSNGVYLSLYLQLVLKDSKSKNVKAIIDAFLLGRDGAPSSLHGRRCVHVYPPEGPRSFGCPQFVNRSVLESDYVKGGYVTFMVGVMVLGDSPIPMPSSDIVKHFGRILDHAEGSDDVAFSVGGETFRAHRAVLAARSPVFKAQLLGSMAEAKMRCITLHDINPATFQILLRFIYTDELPRDEEIQSSSNIDLFHKLLEAADMYQMDRLKLMCARRLWECVSAETVAKVLGWAELHNCPELKSACLDFFVVEKNFKIAVLTEGYLQLMQSFPSIIGEIRARVQT